MSDTYRDPNMGPTGPYGGQPGGPYGDTSGATRVPEPPTDADISYERYRHEDRSLGEIAGDVMGNASTLIRQEVALAKAEVSQSASKAGKGIGFLVGAGVAGLLALIALTLGLWWAIGVSMDGKMGLAGLIVMVIWLIVAAILGVVGKGELSKIKGLPQTQETIQKIPNAVAGNEEKNR